MRENNNLAFRRNNVQQVKPEEKVFRLEPGLWSLPGVRGLYMITSDNRLKLAETKMKNTKLTYDKIDYFRYDSKQKSNRNKNDSDVCEH